MKVDLYKLADSICKNIRDERQEVKDIVTTSLSLIHHLPNLEGHAKEKRDMLKTMCIEYLQKFED